MVGRVYQLSGSVVFLAIDSFKSRAEEFLRGKWAVFKKRFIVGRSCLCKLELSRTLQHLSKKSPVADDDDYISTLFENYVQCVNFFSLKMCVGDEGVRLGDFNLVFWHENHISRVLSHEMSVFFFFRPEISGNREQQRHDKIFLHVRENGPISLSRAIAKTLID